MSQQKFHADPDELESMAGELEPLPEQLVGEARARLTQVERAASANPGWFSSTAMSYACQQLRLQFEAAAKNVTGYAAAARSNAANYRSADSAADRHLRQIRESI
jgi:hypothetical protein